MNSTSEMSTTPMLQDKSEDAAVPPGLMFAIIPLVFLSAVLIIILVLYSFRLARAMAAPPYDGAPPPSMLPLRLHRTHTAPSDLEPGSRSRDMGQRTELDARSAALWARSMLANPSTREECATSPSLKIIPVKQAVVVMQPDGERSLGVTTEFLLKDACLQVTEADLLAFKNSRARWRASSIDTIDTDTQIRPSRTGSSEGLYDSAAMGYPDSTASSSSGRIAPSNSVNNVSFEQPDDIEACRTIERTQRRRRNDCPDAGAVHNEEKVEDTEVEQRQRRRRRRRRRGTRDFSCQTDELFPL